MKKLLLSILFFKIINITFSQVSFQESNLPIFIINTNGRYIPDEPKIVADMKVIWNSEGKKNTLSDTTFHYIGKIGIETRGSTSQILSEKKPYSIELRDTAGVEDQDFALLGLPKNADWALIAPYSDKSLIRDALIYQLARSYMAWAPRTRFCEVVVNGNYQGIYVLTERIKRDKNRINIAKGDPNATAGDALTGGYILKIDKTTGETGIDYSFNSSISNSTSRPSLYIYHYPKPEDMSSAQKTYIKGFIKDVETALNNLKYTDTLGTISKYIDVNTFVDFLIANEITRNVDGYRLSTYMHKDKNSIDGRLKMGSVWDFNIAFGNANYCDGGKTTGWAFDFNRICPSDGWGIPFYWSKLTDNIFFRKLLKERWKQLRGNELADLRINNAIDSMATLLDEAQNRNFQQWRILGKYIWPNNFIGANYSSEVSYLKSWIRDRLLWLDGQIPNLSTDTIKVYQDLPLVVFPNPSVSETTFKFSISSFTIIDFYIYNSLGEIIYADNTSQLPGDYQFVWNQKVPSGIYFYEVRYNNKRAYNGRIFRQSSP